MKTRAEFVDGITKRVEAALAAQPHRVSPSFDDLKVAISAVIEAFADEAFPPDHEEPSPTLSTDPSAPPAATGVEQLPTESPGGDGG